MKNKKLVAIITLLCFALTFVPFAAFADDTELEQVADETVLTADTEMDTFSYLQFFLILTGFLQRKSGYIVNISPYNRYICYV